MQCRPSRSVYLDPMGRDTTLARVNGAVIGPPSPRQLSNLQVETEGNGVCLADSTTAYARVTKR
jgi:hypothetical protein